MRIIDKLELDPNNSKSYRDHVAALIDAEFAELVAAAEAALTMYQNTLPKYWPDEIDPIHHVRGHLSDTVAKLQAALAKIGKEPA